MANRPLISVIVIAHERKEFILDAIRSLKDQSAPKESYEVLIIKKFVDREIDDFIAKNEYKNLLTTVDSLSGKINEAMESCNGFYASFLEDDDLFVKDKISELIKIIKEYPDSIYIHNDHITMDKNGKLREFKLGIPFKNILNLKLNTTKFLDFAKVARNDPDFNLSSITIGIDVLKEYMKKIENINYVVDSYLYLSSIDYGRGRMVITPQKLTLYRYYRKSGMTIMPIEGRTPVNIGQYIVWQSYFNKLYLGVFKTKIPMEILNMKIIEEDIKISILTEKLKPIKDVKSLVKFSIFGFKIREFYKIELVILSLLNVFSHTLSKNVYIKSGLFSSKHYPNID